MTVGTRRKELITEITNLVMASSDEDNLILSAFIAGMQAKGRYLANLNVGELKIQPSPQQ